MNMKFSMLGVVAALALMGSAFAGTKFFGSGSVIIKRNADGSGLISGYLGMIYNGTGRNEYFGCQRYDNGGMYCLAMNENKEYVNCVGSAYLAKSLSTLSPDARLQVNFDANGYCTQVWVVHSSEYADKQG
jgi:hypothetical protein